MKKFKKGDKVRFRKDFKVDRGFPRKYADTQLIDGNIYEVSSDNLTGSTLHIKNPYKGCAGNCYNPAQFELVEDKIEKWAIKVDQSKPEIAEWFEKNKAESSLGGYKTFQKGYLHYPSHITVGEFACHQTLEIAEGYKEVSYEWFRENILKQKEQMTEFPKEFSVLGGQDLKQFVKDYQEKYTDKKFYINGDKLGYYYHFKDSAIYDYNRTVKHTLVTVDQLRQEFLPVKKQTGWRIKPGFKEVVNEIILSYDEFPISCGSANKLKKLNVLEIFCDPVFEEDKKKDVILTIGANNHKITINGTITVEGVVVSYLSLEDLIAKYIGVSNITNWTAYLKEDVRAIRIGCGNFSINELKQVVDEYKKWNAK